MYIMLFFFPNKDVDWYFYFRYIFFIILIFNIVGTFTTNIYIVI